MKKIYSIAVLSTALFGYQSVQAQSPIESAVQGAAQGAAQGFANEANRAVNNALGVPQTNAGAQVQGNLNQPGLNAQGNLNQQGLNTQGNINAYGQPGLNQYPNQPNQYPNQYGNQQLAPGQYGYSNNADVNAAVRSGRVAPNARVQSQTQMQGGYGADGSSMDGRRLGVNLSGSNGLVTISQVQPNSVAATYGLRPGDQIVAIDGQAVQDANNVSNRIRNASSDRVDFVVRRANGQEEKLTVNFGAAPGTYGALEARIEQLERQLEEMRAMMQSLEVNAEVTAE